MIVNVDIPKKLSAEQRELFEKLAKTFGRDVQPQQNGRGFFDRVMDFFAGSGTLGEAALVCGRNFLLIDNNPQALAVMAKRFAGVAGIEWVGYSPEASV